MNITQAPGRIKNLRARIEFHGDDPHQAANVNVIFNVTEGLDDILKTLGIGSLTNDLFDDDGLVRTGATEFVVKNPLVDVSLMLRPSKGKGTASIRGDMKHVAIVPKVGRALEITARIAGEISESSFCYLWKLWGDGDCLVSLQENQLALADTGRTPTLASVS